MADASTGTIVGYGGTILRTTNGGTTWTSQTSGTSEILVGVCMTGLNEAIVVGLNGIILRTTDGGATWVTRPGGTSQILIGVSMSDANTGAIVGWGGTILRTIDGGSTWTSQTSGTAEHLYGVSFANENIGTVVGLSGLVLRTINGGTTWTSQSSTTIEYLYGVSFADTNNGIAVGSAGTLIQTTNGGDTWIDQSTGTSDHLYAASLLNAGTGTVVGANGKIFHAGSISTGLPPVVADIPDKSTIGLQGWFIRVDDFVSDPDNPDTDITWSWSGNANLRINWDALTRRIRLRASPLWRGSETITFTATDPQGQSDSDAATFSRVDQQKGESEEAEGLPLHTALSGNYPNPFNPVTHFRFEIADFGFVELKVYDVLGREVTTLVSEHLPPGRYTREWDARGYGSGVYFYRFETGTFSQTGKLILLH
jgi:photosystem II stability/assembly factor-like uncharacterized protein